MIVYIVTSGKSSRGARRIHAVFDNREQAENFCAVCEEVCFDDQIQIEEWDTEGVHIDCKREVKIEWAMSVYPNGTESYLEKRFTFRDEDKIEYEERDGWLMWKTFPRSMPEEQVREAMLKRLEEWKETQK